jgi:Flp pilus assembly protein TadD
VERLRGNYDAAIQWADKGLAIHPEDTELMRHKAMAYACKGDLTTASKVIGEAINIGNNDLVYAVSLVIENELGNTENVEAIKEIYKNAEVEIPERVQSCLDGKMTAKEVFTEGTGDV